MSTTVELARQHWEEGFRRFQAQAGRGRHALLWDQVEVVTSELRLRAGATYTLAELAGHYRDADAWALTALERAQSEGWERNVSLVTDAAFHLYARGAQDYRP
ncbi:MAG: hypothetical protein C5B48_15840 [Candidatus Rokuibacteriota bacterium]|nr:MAG: hypothetical protein C5B48_15840 [Candidatus Rokubacteria bacterium]